MRKRVDFAGLSGFGWPDSEDLERWFGPDRERRVPSAENCSSRLSVC